MMRPIWEKVGRGEDDKNRERKGLEERDKHEQQPDRER